MIKKKSFGRRNVKMKIKNVEMRTFFEIETEEGEIYRKDSFKYWEKYDGSESWSQLYPSDELVEMERLFQEYLRSDEICGVSDE